MLTLTLSSCLILWLCLGQEGPLPFIDHLAWGGWLAELSFINTSSSQAEQGESPMESWDVLPVPHCLWAFR